MSTPIIPTDPRELRRFAGLTVRAMSALAGYASETEWSRAERTGHMDGARLALVRARVAIAKGLPSEPIILGDE
jgi:hypothetical protein